MSVVPILTYHNIAKPPAGAALRGLYIHPKSFRRQLQQLKLLGYRGVGMSQALPSIGSESRARLAVITFDDGYADVVDAALPLLREFEFTATCYVVSGRLGSWNEWDASALGVRKQLLTISQLREWHSAGMEVGAHTQTHPFLTKCLKSEIEHEILGSKLELESMIGAPVTQFCYPYGDYNSEVEEVVRKAGFHSATTTQRGRARSTDPLFRLPRVPVGGRNLPHLFLLKILTPYEDWHR